MNCRGASRRLSAFIDNDLSPGIRQAVEEHLQSCIPCKRKLAEYEAIVAGAQSLPSLSISNGFGERVVNIIRSRQKNQEVLGVFRYRFTIAGVAFAVTAAAVFFLVGPSATNIMPTFSSTEDSLTGLSTATPDFWAHPETKVNSFPIPEGANTQETIESVSIPSDTTIRVEEYVLPEYQRVKETIDRKF